MAGPDSPALFSCSVRSFQFSFIRSLSDIHRSACSCNGRPSHLFSILASVGLEMARVETEARQTREAEAVWRAAGRTLRPRSVEVGTRSIVSVQRWRKACVPSLEETNAPIESEDDRFVLSGKHKAAPDRMIWGLGKVCAAPGPRDLGDVCLRIENYGNRSHISELTKRRLALNNSADNYGGPQR